MEPEKPSLPPAVPGAESSQPALSSAPTEPAPPGAPEHGPRSIFVGPQGLRAGWSVLVLYVLFVVISGGLDALLLHFHLISQTDLFSPQSAFFSELANLLALLGAAMAVGPIEGRRIADYNLTGARRPQHFFFGLVTGFLALCALVGGLAAGGWLHIAHGALSGARILVFALLWGCVFLLTGFFEEGTFRCYLQFTLTRGINFWWAFGILAATCGYLAMFVGGSASWGVYAAALLGFFPCLALHHRSASGRGFWCAAWVTSALFGFLHVGNPGEAWIGIFAAAFIGFVFCVSIRLTGSAWWAIGCHASWDWAETFFFGTADSGLTPRGTFLTGTATGNPLWSGGTVGPEGSLLVLGAILLLLALLFLYGLFNTRSQSAPATIHAAD